jgi:hypothetical protein
MADWRQIQARIRKAKTGTDAAAKLAELYERTRDAMVAFELAQWHEKAGEHAEAARWYTAAAERFRRSQWKTKAEAALARLRAGGAPVESAEGSKVESVPEAEVAESAEEPAPEYSRPTFQVRPTFQPRPAIQARAASASESHERVSEAEAAGDATEGEAGQSEETKGRAEEIKDRSEEMQGSEAAPAATETAGPARGKPRRRGRRGGRNRRRGPATAPGAAPAPSRVPMARPALRQEEVAPAQPVMAAIPPEEPIGPSSIAPAVAWRERSRAGEPALASRMAQLESQVRRLLACPPVQLDLAETAPAGPGVLLLSDSDQVTHYYIESCQTLRIAIANLTRGGRGAKDNPRLRERLGENLGIAESRVASYLKEHCAVRWLQLDEGASHLAHFAIAVLRPVVNE